MALAFIGKTYMQVSRNEKFYFTQELCLPWKKRAEMLDILINIGYFDILYSYNYKTNATPLVCGPLKIKIIRESTFHKKNYHKMHVYLTAIFVYRHFATLLNTPSRFGRRYA